MSAGETRVGGTQKGSHSPEGTGANFFRAHSLKHLVFSELNHLTSSQSEGHKINMKVLEEII